MTDMVPAAVVKARGEAAKMQALADRESKDKGHVTLAAWDWQRYAEQLRKMCIRDRSKVRSAGCPGAGLVKLHTLKTTG